MDFPEGRDEEFSGIVSTLRLYYRNIYDLSSHMISHTLFENVTILDPSIYEKNNERIYADIDSGLWWESVQVSFCDTNHYILLTILHFLTT